MRIHQARGIAMGGPWQVRYREQAGVEHEVVHATVLSALAEVEAQMSHFREHSALMRLNRTPVGQWFTVPAQLYEVLAAALAMYDYTQGAVDVALGRSIEAWGFGRSVADASVPSSLSSLPASSEAGFLLGEAYAVQRTRDVALNLSCIAKGYAVDYAARALRRLGVAHFMVEAAGEVVCQGWRAPKLPWQIGLELPLAEKTLVYDYVALQDGALAGSGGYRKYRRIGEEIYGHTLDPVTHKPLEGALLSVMVADEFCMSADALATGLYVMGAVHGSAFADKEEIAALFLLQDEEGICEIRSKAWVARFAR